MCLGAAACGSSPPRHPDVTTSDWSGATFSPGRATAGRSFAGTDRAPTPAPSTASPPPDAGLSLSFAGLPDRSLAGYRGPGNRVFTIQFDYDGTGLAIRSGRMVRAHDTAQGAPILIVPNPRVPASVSASFVFVPGQPATENLVVGTCATAFRESSVQLAVWPDHWRLLYTLYSPARSRTISTTLASGMLPRPVATDGHTAIRVSMTRTAADTVQLRLPGVERSVSNPAVARYWGREFGIQIRHPAGTGGDAAVLAIADQLS